MICQEALLYIKTCHLSKLKANFFFLSRNQTCLRDSDSDVAGSLKRQRKDEHDDVPHCEQDELQIKNDEVAIALQKELDKEEIPFTNKCQVIIALEEKVISNGRDSLYVVVRRKTQLDRKLKIWQRATKKIVTRPHPSCEVYRRRWY